LKEESIFIPMPVGVNTGSKSQHAHQEILHLKRFYSNPNSTPVLMIHGSIENGKIFYSSSGKGLAPYLAKNGYDVFVVDLRGRGLSTPSISKHSKHGLSEILHDDFPAYIHKIKEIKGNVPQHWIAHSWGGVMMLAYLAKYFGSVRVASMVFFGTKRRLTVLNPERLWKINVMWYAMAQLGISLKGYIPAKEAKVGSDNETKKSHKQAKKWVQSKKWIDWNDKFDYATALKKIKLPPTLYLTGKNDHIICNPKDIKLLMKETGEQDHQYKVMGKSTGYKHDYGHNDILTHVDAPNDVYPVVLDFMNQRNLSK
jgi:predicted alpha/beta hydrolase